MVQTSQLCIHSTSNKDDEGLEEDVILNLLHKETIVEHNHNKENYNEAYEFANAECNVHLIQDLKKVIENLNHTWAKRLIELLEKRIIKGKVEMSSFNFSIIHINFLSLKLSCKHLLI